MVRWFKLFDHQYFGFWVLGLVLFAIQEIPYMVMPLFHLETNPIMNMVETSAALDVCEKVLGSLCIALMIFVVHEEAVLFSAAEGRERLFFADGQPIVAEGARPVRATVRRGPGDLILLDRSSKSFYQSVSRVFYGRGKD